MTELEKFQTFPENYIQFSFIVFGPENGFLSYFYLQNNYITQKK